VNKPLSERRSKVDQRHPELSITRQCKVLQIHRSGLYYKPVGETAFNLKLMRMIDEQHMLRPWYGVPRMTDWLRLDKGLNVNHKRIERLYRLLGIQAIGPKPNMSKPGKGHKIYPYLLRKLKINRPNHVWAMDITYIPVQGGYLYLVAVIDLYSRYVLNWSLSNTMTAEWCRDALNEAIERYGPPEIVNTDQGSQFTSEVFSEFVVTEKELKLSMDGKDRAIDNIFIERLWRSVKYEQVYVYPATDGLESYQGLRKYFDYYNNERRHSSLKKQTPVSVYQQELKHVA